MSSSSHATSSEGRLDVALAVVRRNRLWLVSRRRTDDVFDGLWEFCGGKILPGESAAQAAVRECAEELPIAVEPTREMAAVEYDYPDVAVRLHVVMCRHVVHEPVPTDPAVSQVRWVDGPTLAGLEMPAANDEIVRALLEVRD